MLKGFSILLVSVLVAACTNKKVEGNAELYTIDDIKTMTIIRYLSEENASCLNYYKNLIVPLLMNNSEQAFLFEEFPLGSKCSLIFVFREPNKMPCGIQEMGFRITIDEEGILYFNDKIYNPKQLAKKYYNYYNCDEPENSKPFECAEKNVVDIPKLGRFEKSLGFFQMRIILPNTKTGAFKILSSFRSFTRLLFYNLYFYRNELSHEFFDQSFFELNQSDKLKIVRMSEFYSELYLSKNNKTIMYSNPF